ncbi:MAG: methyltransferase domain-containing protein, partial [Planctomycetota bacterium]
MSNTETIKKNFSRYARQYDNYANIQNQSAEKLIETIEKKQFDKILDIGCGTGCYTKLLQNHFPAAKIKALDISSEMINVAKDKLAHSNIDFLIADGQKIALDEKFDLITSNACFQWFDN